jgi:hypothetical protein
VEDASHLGAVADAGDVHLPVGDALGERAEDRAGREHGRADPDAAARPLDPVGDAGGERFAVAGREPGAHLASVHVDRARLHEAALLDRARRPELLEVPGVRGSDFGGLDDHDDVLAAGPGIVGPVRRAGPDRPPVADRVLVVHQVGNARNRLRRDGETVDQGGLAAGRGEDGRGLLAVDIECEPDRDPAFLRVDDGAGDDPGGRLEEIEVVQRQVEASSCVVEESGEAFSDLQRGLPAVRERMCLDHEAGPYSS